MKLKEKTKHLKKDIPAIFLALKNRDTPIVTKLFVCVTIVYALSPIDLIPDFIPVLGYLDDVIILPLLVSLTVKLIPKAVLEKCREQSENM